MVGQITAITVHTHIATGIGIVVEGLSPSVPREVIGGAIQCTNRAHHLHRHCQLLVPVNRLTLSSRLQSSESHPGAHGDHALFLSVWERAREQGRRIVGA